VRIKSLGQSTQARLSRMSKSEVGQMNEVLCKVLAHNASPLSMRSDWIGSAPSAIAFIEEIVVHEVMVVSATFPPFTSSRWTTTSLAV
jgi:hypothetical protein